MARVFWVDIVVCVWVYFGKAAVAPARVSVSDSEIGGRWHGVAACNGRDRVKYD